MKKYNMKMTFYHINNSNDIDMTKKEQRKILSLLHIITEVKHSVHRIISHLSREKKDSTNFRQI
jgi:hypothetical protein